MKQHKLSIFFIALMLLTCSSLFANQEQSAKKEHIEKVAENLWKGISVSFPKPVIEVKDLNIKSLMAEYNPKTNIISLSYAFYDICLTIGEEALAAVLAHEMGHYFNQHKKYYNINGFYISEAEKEFVSSKFKFDLDTAKVHEAQADLFAAFLCYSVGYDISSSWIKVLEKAYSINKEIEQDNSPYLPKEKRIELANQALNTIKELIPLFEAGLYLNYVMDYELSARCFDYIIKMNFTSWEVYHNAGIGYALAAIKLLTNEEKQFIFPFEIQSNTQIEKEDALALIMKGGNYSIDELTNYKYRLYLAQAKERFQSVMNIQSNSAISMLNFACVSLLLGDSSDARKYILRAEDINCDVQTKQLVYIAKGIIYSHRDSTEADKAFMSAGNSALAKYNLNIHRKIENKKTEIEKSRILTEKVSGKAVQEINSETFTYKVNKYNKIENIDLNNLIVRSYKESDMRVLKIEDEDKVIGNFIEVNNNYKGESSNGIKIGTEQKLVIDNYGTPNRIITTNTGELLVYEGIMVRIEKDKVNGWIIY